MKMNRQIFLSVLLLIVLTGCHQQNPVRDEFTIYAYDENMGAESREYLYKCLATKEIEYQVDDERNVLIQNKDVEHAVIRCS